MQGQSVLRRIRFHQNKKKLKYLIPIVLSLLLFAACNEDLPNDGVPSYLRISDPSVSVKPNQGTASHKITEVWVEVNGVNLGAYELPVRLPVLTTGESRIIIQPGIRQNGIQRTRVVYPFYTPFSIDTILTEKMVLHLKPQFQFVNGIEFAMSEDFDAGTAMSNMAVTNNSNVVFEGTGSGHIRLDDLNSTVESKTLSDFVIPFGQSYIEMNYRSENFFRVGLEGNKGGQTIRFDKLFIAPSADWNKIYVHLTNDIADIRAQTYKLYLAATKSDSLSTADIYIDNLRVVHFRQ